MVKIHKINRESNSKLVLFVKGHVEGSWILCIEAWLKVYKQISTHVNKCLCIHNIANIECTKNKKRIIN